MVDGCNLRFRAFYPKQCSGKGKQTLGAGSRFAKGDSAAAEAIAVSVFGHIWLGFPKAAGAFYGYGPILFDYHLPSLHGLL